MQYVYCHNFSLVHEQSCSFRYKKKSAPNITRTMVLFRNGKKINSGNRGEKIPPSEYIICHGIILTWRELLLENQKLEHFRAFLKTMNKKVAFNVCCDRTTKMAVHTLPALNPTMTIMNATFQIKPFCVLFFSSSVCQ